MRLITRSITAALISCAFSASWAANTITPQNGNWVVTNELGGKPGRGMGIDVQDGVFVMQLYNYNKDGSATFHMATGKVVDNKVVTPLKQYKDGPYFGGGQKDGTEAANAGNVEVEFTSRTTANIKFPGEAVVQMQRFNYESTPEGQWSDKSYAERWAMVEFDENDKPIGTFFADIGVGSQLALLPDMSAGWPYATSDNFTVRTFDVANSKQYGVMECDYTGGNHTFACAGDSISTTTGSTVKQSIDLSMQRSLDELHGTIKVGANGAKHRILGARVEKSAYSTVDGKLVRSEYFRRNSLPEAGTWIVTKEVTGKAGRGISLDIQKPTNAKHMLFMPIYNYDSKGNATFHLGMEVHSPSVIPKPETPSIKLMTYKNGRYLGGPAKDAVEDTYTGPAEITFATTATGLIQFPHEDSINIQRYYFGVNPESVDSLVGTWALVPHAGAAKHRVLNLVKTGTGVVEDKEAGYTCVSNYWLEFRFVCEPKTITSDQQRIRIGTGFYGAARGILGDGGTLLDTSPEVTIMRISDGQGNLVQAGPLYPSADEGSTPGDNGNAAPVARIASVAEVAQNATVTLNGSESSDAEGAALTYQWTLTSIPEGSSAKLSAETTSKPQFVGDKSGPYVVTLVVSDGTKSSKPVSIIVTVTSPNKIALYDTSDSGPNVPLAWPYTTSNVNDANITCVGTCNTTFKVAGYRLVANGQAYTITKLTATNLSSGVGAGSTVLASFEGLQENQVIESGSSANFTLRSSFTKGKATNLRYTFTVKETGQTFTYNTTLTTN